MTILSRTASPRRQLLRMALLGGAASCVAACTVTQTGTVTKATINVTQLLTDGRAIVAALQSALAIPAVVVLLGSNLSLAETALAAAATAMSEIASLTTGTVTLVIDTSRVQALVLSLLADVQTVLALLQTPPAAGVPALPTQVSTIIAAAATLVPLVQLAAGLTAAPPRAAPMTEAEALRIANGA